MQHDTQAAARGPADPLPYLTVAIGASAGGLQAFTEFLANTPSDTGMAFVLIQHLDPIHKSLLVSLLAPHTGMNVVEAGDGMPLAPNWVFIIPPDATLTVSNGRLVLSHPAPARADRRPIDSFFTSLAEDQGSHAVCIVLSGTGSDGTRSLQAVKQHGGLVFAQAQDDARVQDDRQPWDNRPGEPRAESRPQLPAEPQAPPEPQPLTGMPQSAVATGLVDHVLPVRAMPSKLLQHSQSMRESRPKGGGEGEGDDAVQLEPAQFNEICGLVRGRTGHDLSQYKKPMLLRRIRRLMQARDIATATDLIDLLRREPRLVDQLFHEMLLRVTEFFRDRAAFQAVQDMVIPKILADRGIDEPVRIWVPGCASGEEVYSLAILLHEAVDRLATPLKVQMFGTDIDPDAVATARTARYSKSALARLTPERRTKWFVEDGKSYRVGHEIREMCVFSVHSLIKDPPFSKLDMISCRNLLIYFDNELQARAIRNFHYALDPGRWLFLGPSESVAHGTTLFAQIDKRYRIFQRQDAVAALPRLSSHGDTQGRLAHLANAPLMLGNLEDALDRSARRALEPYSPAYVVIDRACNIIRFSGGAVGRYLEPSPGAADLGLFNILRKPLRRAVRTAVQEAMSGHKMILREGLNAVLEGHTHSLTLIVQPLADGRSDRERYLVAFHDAGLARVQPQWPASLATGAYDDHGLAQELAATRSQLMATIADLETANEELKSYNEEFQSANEELQATNEELETAKEEMQSVNEELQTINAELITKNELLTRLNNDFQNLLDATQIATVFLDPQLNITRFTPAMTDLFHLRETDLGRPITDIASRLTYTDLPTDVATVLDKRRIVEREVQREADGAAFLMRIRPYRTIDKAVEGVVIAFIDISGQKRVQAADALQDLNQTLERRVAERTTELAASTHQLTRQTAERRYAEEMLRQSQKLEAVGKLTGGIAHDFNNLLGVIIGNVEFLLDAARNDPDLVDLGREILNSALRGAELTRRLLAFARKQPLQPQFIDLNALLPNHVTMLHRTLGEPIHVKVTLAPDLWLTHADPSQIGDALLNLALNARDAMPHGGKLLIETANVRLNGPSVAEHAEASAGDYVVLAVTDTGTGMPREVIERATEPFFTTKSTAIGSGLGLSMIYGFARQSGGHLTIESKVGVGTAVKLLLPRALDEADAVPEAPQRRSAEKGGNEAILLVDDNATLRAVTERHLVRLGYKVTTAANGPAALAVLRASAAFDLLFTDVVMPKAMSGYDLAEAARALQPALKVLFTTGFAADLSTAGNGRNERRHLLLKPFRQRELAEAVRAALDGKKPAA